jgi:hypothetical protein
LFATSNPNTAPNFLYRYEVPPSGSPSLELTVTENLNRPIGLAFTPAHELFVANWGASGGKGITRFANPGGLIEFNGFVESPDFGGAEYSAFRGNELFVAQQFGGNVLRFLVHGNGGVVANGKITEGLDGTSRGVAVAPWGELFVSLCCGRNVVKRFVFNAAGDAIANGEISGNNLNNPHDIEFSAEGEMFVANAGGNTVSRFLFDGEHNVIANGYFRGRVMNGPIGLAFSPWGELFVANHYGSPGKISRWEFDDAGTAIYNGQFTAPNPLADIEFLPEDPAGRPSRSSIISLADPRTQFAAFKNFAMESSSFHEGATLARPVGLPAEAGAYVQASDTAPIPISVSVVLREKNASALWPFATAGSRPYDEIFEMYF